MVIVGVPSFNMHWAGPCNIGMLLAVFLAHFAVIAENWYPRGNKPQPSKDSLSVPHIGEGRVHH